MLGIFFDVGVTGRYKITLEKHTKRPKQDAEPHDNFRHSKQAAHHTERL